MYINNSRTKSKTNVSVRVNFSRDTLHHAYICVGDMEATKDKILSFIESDFAIRIQGNPDVLYFEYEAFGIDDARFLKEKQQNKASVGDKKFFLVSFGSITVEAQNSLLKIFEEPTAGTHFFILTNTEKILLPTLLSRAQIEFFDSNQISSEVIKSFLSGTQKERLDFIKDIIESKNRGEAVDLLQGISTVLHENIDKKESLDALKKVSNILVYIYDRGASVKMIMEYIALTTPRFMI